MYYFRTILADLLPNSITTTDFDLFRDVLRRHYINCPSRGPQPIPGRLKKGKKTRACDSCARLKLGCDLDCPCETCLSYGLECTYTRLEQQHQQHQHQQQQQPAEASLTGPTHNAPQHAKPSVDDGTIRRLKTLGLGRQERSKISLAFLLNYVNPATTTMAGAYGPISEKAGKLVKHQALK